MIRKTLSLSLVVIITWTTTWATAPLAAQTAPPNGMSYKEAVDLIEDVRIRIDHSQFDPDALLEKLDYNPSEIIRFVKQEICFEQYPGVLRGARGTLMSRAGNSLDQAVLLAGLLKDTGLEARIARGSIGEDEARILLDAMRVCDQNPLPVGDLEAIHHVLGGAPSSLQPLADLIAGLIESWAPDRGASSSTASPEVEEAQEISSFLEPFLLKDAETSDAVPSSLVAEAQDYFWVQYRDKPGATWRNVHQAVPDGSPEPENLDATEFVASPIPAALQHRIRIQAFVEQRLGEKLKIHPIMAPWERPAANMAGLVLSYWNAPNGFAAAQKRGEPVPVETALEQTHYFLPVLNGVSPKGAQIFDLLGNVAPGDMIDASKMALFQTLGGKVGQAAGALGNLGSAKTSEYRSAVGLSRQFIEISLIGPSGEIEVIPRDFVRVGPNDDELGTKKSLTRMMRAGIAVGDFPDALILDNLLGVLSGTIAAAAGTDCDDSDAECSTDKNLATTLEGSALDLNTFFNLADEQGRLVSNHSLVYRHEPSIVAQYFNPWFPGESQNGTDILNNSRRGFRIDERLLPDLFAVLRHGVLESVLESVLVPPLGNTSHSAAESWAALDPTEITPVVLEPGNSQAVDQLPLSDIQQTMVLRDLDQGYTVVFPTLDADRHGTSDWWRLNPTTGETLGMLAEGWGGARAQDDSEELIVTTETSGAVVPAAKKFGARALGCLLLMASMFIVIVIYIKKVTAPAEIAVLLAKFIAAIGYEMNVAGFLAKIEWGAAAMEAIQVAFVEMYASCVGS